MRRVGAGVAGFGLVFAAACSADTTAETGRVPSASTSPSASDLPTSQSGEATPSAEPSPTASAKKIIMMTFDGLNGGSSFVEVYPGYTDAAQDKVNNAVYNVGEQVIAECEVVGRTVRSHPELGEDARKPTNVWFKIGDAVDGDEYATAMYIEDAKKIQAQVPDC